MHSSPELWTDVSWARLLRFGMDTLVDSGSGTANDTAGSELTVLPKTPETYFTERAGVLHVAEELDAMRLIWRETPNADVGIDGQIEFVDADGRTTGRLVAAQVKSGSSYVRRVDDQVVFTPSEKHATYWARFPIPVIVFIHDPDVGRTYWADARQQLLRPGVRSPEIRCDAVLGPSSRQSLLQRMARIPVKRWCWRLFGTWRR